MHEIWDHVSELTVGGERYPGCEAVQTDEEIRDFTRQNLCPIFHAAGTCVMGKGSDKDAVVNSWSKAFRAKGRGCECLPAPGYTIHMLAEKIADGIKDGR